MRTLRDLRAGDVWLALLVLAGLAVLAVLKSTPGGGGADTFAATDYRSGGYAAWYELLRREGVAVERFERRPAYLDANIDTLIAATPLTPLGAGVRGPADRAALARWVRAGGRLIALGAGGLALPGGRRDASSRPFGSGEIVSIRDPHPFDNALLTRGDNARRAYALAKPRRPGGVVAFDEALHGAIVDRAWWQAIDVPARVALGGVALAVVLALGGSALRLGPPVTLRAAREPASDEFVAAVASLYERTRARRAAIGLLAAGARHASGDAVTQLRALAERQTPSDRDLIASAVLARAIREGS